MVPFYTTRASAVCNAQHIPGSQRASAPSCITRADPFLRAHRIVDLDAGNPTCSLRRGAHQSVVWRPRRPAFLASPEPGITETLRIACRAWGGRWLRLYVWCALMSHLRVTLMAGVRAPCPRTGFGESAGARWEPGGKAKLTTKQVIFEAALMPSGSLVSNTPTWDVAESDDLLICTGRLRKARI